MESEALPNTSPSTSATNETVITIEHDPVPVNHVEVAQPVATASQPPKAPPGTGTVAPCIESGDKKKDAKTPTEHKAIPPITPTQKSTTPLLLSPNACSSGIVPLPGSISPGERRQESQSRSSKLNEKQHSTNASHNALPLLDSGKSSLSRLLSGSGSCLVSSAGTPSDEKLDAKMPDGKTVTPRRHQRSNIKGLPLESNSLKLSRNFRQPIALSSALKAGPKGRACEQHCFLTDVADVRQMEQGLLQLLDDFHSGKLQAFSQDCTVEKMEQVREQQERLARLHFDLNSGQEIVGPQTNEGRQMAKENLPKLIENLHQLSLSIEQLQSASPGVQTQV